MELLQGAFEKHVPDGRLVMRLEEGNEKRGGATRSSIEGAGAQQRVCPVGETSSALAELHSKHGDQDDLISPCSSVESLYLT